MFYRFTAPLCCFLYVVCGLGTIYILVPSSLVILIYKFEGLILWNEYCHIGVFELN